MLVGVRTFPPPPRDANWMEAQRLRRSRFSEAEITRLAFLRWLLRSHRMSVFG